MDSELVQKKEELEKQIAELEDKNRHNNEEISKLKDCVKKVDKDIENSIKDDNWYKLEGIVQRTLQCFSVRTRRPKFYYAINKINGELLMIENSRESKVLYSSAGMLKRVITEKIRELAKRKGLFSVPLNEDHLTWEHISQNVEIREIELSI